ncbi:ProQ/FINO family protein [Neorhizobium sp. P12A]|uniref:ProQ/FINO family protein n=1 Tax=Neorhizobium sp. P12A TaxID=2268027 RepID=UPI0011F04BD1|nr:ProQ/FINO family protein [Neorhizobium sp. P12A]KAA0693723.1 ProQ/FINO family protein [Neorhizobium sp. P12A]
MTKAWTVSRGPIAANEIGIEKANAINLLLVRPIGILPTVPGDQIRPFAVGLFDEIRLLLKPDIAVTTLRRAVAAFVHSKRYYFASAQPDAMRHDIDGNSVEAIAEADRLIAQQRFLTLQRTRAQPDGTQSGSSAGAGQKRASADNVPSDG